MNRDDPNQAAGTRRRTPKRAGQREHRLSVRGERRTPADLRKLSRALISIALADAAAETAARVEHQATIDGLPKPEEAA
jgi:hypothetical protein